MKKIIIAMAAIAAAFTMASCNKEQPVSPIENPTVGESVITASIENDATKTALTPDEEGYKVVWTAGDQLFVGDDQGTDWCAKYTLDNASADSSKGVFSWQKGDFFYTDLKEKYTEPLFEVDNTYIAMYPSDLYELDDEGEPAYGITWKTEQAYSSTDRYIPMYGVAECSNEGVVDFKFNNLGGILRLTVKGSASIKSIRIEANEILSGPIARIDGEGVEGNEFIACLEAVSENNKKYIDLNCRDGAQLSSDGTDFYISMPCKFSYDEKDNIVFDGYTDVTITLTDTKERTCVKKLNNKKLFIERSKITTATFTASEFKANVPEGALPGKFSVSAGKQVQFSSGNLTATVDATGAPTAWKFAANQYDYLGEGGANMTIGTAAGDVDLFGWSTAATTYGINSSDSEKDYSGEFVDWGKEVGDGKTWRTLSIDEWKYMLYNRTVNGGTDEGKSFSINITFGGKTGLVLYPDDYDKEPISGTVTELPDGVVFLPTAGSRTGSEVFAVDDFGRYWSSSSLDEDFALYVSFSSDGLGPNNWVRSDGYSVRLVTDVK